ncbi:MAG: EAL domain-containing protein, partial [Actinomycetota bacterium]|nr:EAL domain-containing protein [Actinomycetota bacterium]
GNLVGITGVTTDITELKRAQERLRETEEKYRTLVEQIPVVTYIDRADGSDEPLYTSPQIEQMLGYTPEEWLEGRLWPERLHPEDRERVLAADERFEAGGEEPFSEEYRLIAKDGSVVWVREEAVLVTDETRKPLYWQGVIFDITARKKAAEAIERLRHRNQLILDSAGEGIYGLDREGKTTFVNPAAAAFSGFDPEELIGKTQHDVIHHSRPDGSPYPKEECPIYSALRDGEVHHVDDEVFWRKDGTSFPVEYTSTPIWEDGEVVGAVVTFTDATERKALEVQLERQAFRDSLTDLPNRHLFMNRLGHALERTRRRRGTKVVILFMDLDNFKVINDSLGHRVGDLLLVVVAQRLRRCLRPEDTLARFGGDEFVVLLEDVEKPVDALRVAGRITDELRRPFTVEGRELFVTASIGIALGDARAKDPQGLVQDADTAMYRAKEEGSDYKVFDPAMYERAMERLELENDLRRALENEEFTIYYQPRFRLGQSDRIEGVEALVRWEHPNRGLLLPDDFVPIAEETGLIIPIGGWVIREACRQAKEWQERYPSEPPLSMCVNLSAGQVRRPSLLRDVGSILLETGLKANSLILEITEGALLKDTAMIATIFRELKALGVRLAIDDFGKEYSSLSYLGRLPLDALKIDDSFVESLGESPTNRTIVEAVISLTHSLGLEVVGEGVESAEQLERLRRMGCDLVQGYHLARPSPSEEVEWLLEEGLFL